MNNKSKAILATLIGMLASAGFIELVLRYSNMVWWVLVSSLSLFCMYYFYIIILEYLNDKK
jgi:hypothetical protein